MKIQKGLKQGKKKGTPIARDNLGVSPEEDEPGKIVQKAKRVFKGTAARSIFIGKIEAVSRETAQSERGRSLKMLARSAMPAGIYDMGYKRLAAAPIKLFA